MDVHDAMTSESLAIAGKEGIEILDSPVPASAGA